MAKTTAIYQPKGYSFSSAIIVPADATTAKLVATPATDDSICKALLITSTDTVSQEVQIIVQKGGTDYVIGTVSVPAQAGTIGSVPAVDGLSIVGLPEDRVNKKVLPLDGASTLRARVVSTITASKQVAVSAVLENF